MSELTSYTYTVLRYVHDISTEEFVNVGVVLHAPDLGYLQAKMRTTYGRLSRVFPDLDGDAFKRTMAHVEKLVERAQVRLDDLFPEKATALEFATRVLTRDDSSLQWSSLGSGRTRNPDRELEVLFDKLVLRYERGGPKESRSDEDVWKEFSRALQRERLLPKLQQKEIVSSVDRKLFSHAWKNSQWHCLEPVSFDLVDGESIHNKATRWLGQMHALANSPSDSFKIYLLLGAPKHPAMQQQYQKALQILGTMPVSNELVPESEAEELAKRIASDIDAHERGG